MGVGPVGAWRRLSRARDCEVRGERIDGAKRERACIAQLWAGGRVVPEVAVAANRFLGGSGECWGFDYLVGADSASEQGFVSSEAMSELFAAGNAGGV